jgi:vanillate O-demethylase ferredoxin subunit
VEIETGIVRPYSLCGDPADRTRYQIAVKRELRGRGGSLRMHEHVQKGSAIRVGIPRNNFALSTAGDCMSEVLLIAGGIGLTPLVAMARTLHAALRPFTFHVCARDLAQLSFGREWEDWPFRTSVHVHLDSEVDLPAGGRVDIAGLVPSWDERGPRELYTCGPVAFIDAVRRRAKEAGWPEAALHVERFSNAAGAQPGDKPFTLHLERSHATIVVAPDQTIVDAMEAQGFQTRTSCREGLCGTCVCRVVAGEVEHRDLVLSEEERRSAGNIAICVSRAQGGSLSLDL